MEKSRSYIKSLNRILSLCLAVLFIAAASIGVSAATHNEQENNNTYTKANATSNDDNCYGNISSTSDVDWWKITFSSVGMANFYLGNIPSGCNYELEVYKTNSDSSNRIATSDRGSNNYEQIQCKVYTGITYYVKISSTSGSSTSSKYLFRAKNYPLGNYYLYGFNYYGCQSSTSTDNLYYGDAFLSEMGFSGDVYENQSAATILNSLPDARICIINADGDAGYVQTNTGKLYALYNSQMTSSDRAISTLVWNALENVNSLTIFASSNSGLTGNNNTGNLVDMVRNKGAHVCMGWNKPTGDYARWYWYNKFFVSLYYGKSVYDAANDADSHSIAHAHDSNIADRYFGSGGTAWAKATVFN